LSRNPAVHAALVALLAGETPQLPGAPPPPPGTPTSASDMELRQVFREKIDWTRLDTRQRRAFIDSLTRAPPAAPQL
jgi:hypothetical protein